MILKNRPLYVVAMLSAGLASCGPSAQGELLSDPRSDVVRVDGVSSRSLVAMGSTESLSKFVLGSQQPEPMVRFRSLWRNNVSRSAWALHRGSGPADTALTMAVFGDSLAAATFAGTTIGDHLKPGDTWRVLRAISMQYLFPHDDLSRYLERVKRVVGYETFNGFSGSEPWSHRQRISSQTGVRVSGFNYAVPGARTEHLDSQVAVFTRDFGYSPMAPAYVAMSVGGNDFCDNFPVDRAVEALYRSIREIRAVLPQSLILISGIPDVVSVFDDYDRVAFKLPGYALTCRERARIFPMCAREADLLSGDEASIASAKQDLLRYQKAFAELARRLEANFPLEGPVRYAPLPRLSDEDGLLAADCFHPGVDGHHAIADATWNSVAEAFNLEGSSPPVP